MPDAPAERQYDVWARWYDVIWGLYSARTTSALLSRLDVRPEEVVLDVGCGTGAIERQLLKKNPRQQITGVDVSEKMLRRARAVAGGSAVTYVRAPASELPLEADRFDLVVSASALHYFPEPVAALLEMRRVVKQEGRVVIMDWCRESAAMKLRDAVLRVVDPAHVRCYTESELRAIFADAGLTVDHAQVFSSGTYRLIVVWGRPPRPQHPTEDLGGASKP